MWKSIFSVVMCVLAASAAGGQQPTSQLHTLPASDKPRFEVVDRTWPAKVGEAQVCLWHDDRLAAASISIDDNHPEDHAWWLEMGKKYGFRFTWFVITSRVGKDWEPYIKLLAAGHDIQSHTVDHFNPRSGKPLPVERNYREAIDQIQQHVPGARVLVMAYPGGDTGKANYEPETAARYYIAARHGKPSINPANQIDYMSTNSMGKFVTSDTSSAGLANAIQLNPDLPACYRGWASFHFHSLQVEGKPAGTPAEAIVKGLDYLSQHADAFWVAPFAEVVRYGQERDTATLQSTPGDAGQWQLTLTDRMDDGLFDFPLTVKNAHRRALAPRRRPPGQQRGACNVGRAWGQQVRPY